MSGGQSNGMIKIGGRVVLMVVVLTTIACDRVTKHAATAMLSGNPGHSYFADSIRLEYAENPGGFLSLGATLPHIVRTAFFTVGTAVMLLTVAIIAVRRSRDQWSAMGLALLGAGGLSNWIDRVARGSVVDFLNVGLGPVRTGVFNIADVAILVGIGMFVLAAAYKRRSNSPDETR